MTQASLLIAVLALTILSSSCASLVKVRDATIPRLITPLAEAKFNDLIEQLQPFTQIQSLRSWSVYIRFIDAESAQRYREAEAILVLKRPDKIRLVIQAPAIKTKIAEMVSEANRFKVAIYQSAEYKRFLVGTNTADYSKWREKLGEKGRSALVSARPFHFTEALMIRPLNIDNSRFIYGVEEALIEEPDLSQGAKKGARVLRSFYVISELELSSNGQTPARMRRRFWFDRGNSARFVRQQIFDDGGQLATDVYYYDFKKPNAETQDLWPSVVLINRPHDGYSARLTFNEERFEINQELPANAFVLENTDGLPETDLDKPK